ncbi:MAG: hypothetical protein ACRDND_20090 [Streptosporangiaceae bacterium]
MAGCEEVHHVASPIPAVQDGHARAAGKRFLALADGPALSFLEVAGILRRRLGPLAAHVPRLEAPGDDPPRPIIHNDRARKELGWRPRAAETTIVESAESLRGLGLLEAESSQLLTPERC